MTAFYAQVLTAGAITEVDPAALTEANWSAVPATLPVVSLAFVFQNIVPVIVTNLEGDIGKVGSLSLIDALLPSALPWRSFLASRCCCRCPPAQLADDVVQHPTVDHQPCLQHVVK